MIDKAESKDPRKDRIEIFDDLVPRFAYEDEVQAVGRAVDLFDKFERGKVDFEKHPSPPDINAISFKGTTIESLLRSFGNFGRFFLFLIKISAVAVVAISFIGLLAHASWFNDAVAHARVRWFAQLTFVIDPVLFMLHGWREIIRPIAEPISSVFGQKYGGMLSNFLAVWGIVLSSVFSIFRARLVRGVVFFLRFKPFQKKLKEQLSHSRQDPSLASLAALMPTIVEVQKTVLSWKKWNEYYERRVRRNIVRQLIVSLFILVTVIGSDLAYLYLAPSGFL